MKVLLITSESKTIVHFGSTLKGPIYSKKNITLSSEKTLSKMLNRQDIVFIEQTEEIQKQLTIDKNNLPEDIIFIFYKEAETSIRKSGNVFFLGLQKGDITKIIQLTNVLNNNANVTQELIKKSIEKEMSKLKSRREKVNVLTNTIPNNDTSMDEILTFEKNGMRFGNKMIIIGASIGGLNVMDEILTSLQTKLNKNEVVPPILYTQHITQSFAQNIITRVDNKTHLTVKAASKHLSILNNHIYMALDQHFVPKLKHGRLEVDLLGDDPVSSHSPSIDVMFRGCANICNNKKTLSIILTGMGRDGVEGMNNLKQVGSITVAQEPTTTVVPGIINECIKQGSIDKILYPEEIVEEIIRFIRS